ncbi:hypothetical protein F5X68DRAFT_196974 [Plectosphaerella plurivora]|uniref:Protein EFR3 n=1 Tax=Plectosphaerella plurivora TaxID=936078 RepID=A0A9P9AFM1_9PEZI|nr:hypothetical protein F5X68DRAFT_196974 [Plectosphaerella plurivora]
MNAIQQKCRPKHQVLVLKCYPRTTKGAVDVKPNSSELSYLLFYATSRRSKIQKIGSFLEKKTATDVWRLRIGDVQVTLEILTALIEKSPKDLPLFATNVLKILDLILGSKDLTMAQSSIPTFEAFCENHDVSSSFAEHGYLAQYESVVRLYATLASTRQSPGKGELSKPVLMRWRNVGLDAIKSVSSSDTLSSTSGRQFSVIVPIILENLWSEDDHLLDSLLARAQSEEKGVSENLLKRRTSIGTTKTNDTAPEPNRLALVGTADDADKLAAEDIGVLALQCLKQIFVVPNQSQIHAATLALLKFIQERIEQDGAESVLATHPKTGTDSGWAIQMFGLVARWAPVQDRYIILVTTMDHLRRLPMAEENIQQHVVLAAMISHLLRSDINLIGLSVMDILLGLIQHMKRLVQMPTASVKAGDNEKEEHSPSASQAFEPDGGPKRDLMQRIQGCIGDLATHVYYADQISDMISAILIRLRPSRSASAQSSPAGEKAEQPANDEQANSQSNLESYLTFSVGRTAALKAIKSILLVANMRTKMSGTMNLSRNRVPMRVWEGTHWILHDTDRHVRRAYVDALVTWLDRETTKGDLQAKEDHHARTHGRTSLKHRSELRELAPGTAAHRASSVASNRERAIKQPRTHFLQLLHLAIYDNALQYIDSDPEIITLHVLLTKLVFQLGVNAVRYGLPMIFRLQEDIQDAETPTQKVRLGSLCHGYFWAVTEKFEVEGSIAGRAILNEIDRRRSKRFWVQAVHVPPPTLEQVPQTAATQPQGSIPVDQELETEALLPFDDRIPLVESVAASYARGFTSPPASPAASPGRSFSHPFLTTSFTSAPLTTDDTDSELALPESFRDLMVTDWSRDAAMLAIQAASKSESLTGSRTGTTGTRHRITLNGGGFGNGQPRASSLFGSHQDLRPSTAIVGGGLAPMNKMRRTSVRSGLSASPMRAERGPITTVDQLKQVLSGRIPSTAITTSAGLRDSDDDSTSDSMVSFDYAQSEVSFNPASQRGEGNVLSPQRPSSAGRGSGRPGSARDSPPIGRDSEDDEVPPVPPLPNLRGFSSGIPAAISTQDHALKPAQRNISVRSGDSRFNTSARDEGPPDSIMDLRDLLLGIDSKAGEQSIGNVTRPPY